jgi:hypothetical protein
MKKRKHHYVWEHYLKAWATDGHVWCQRGETRFPVSTENIAHRHDFYRLKEMSEYDFQIVELMISRMAEHVRPLARGWMPHFRVFHEAKRAYELSGQKSRELEHELDVAINDTEENLHAFVEGKATAILDALRDGDGSILEDNDQFLHFVRFVGMQYMRTPRIMRGAVDALSPMPGFNAEASWGLLRTIFATNIGGSLYARRRTLRLTFLEAPPELELVTGDQPIVNALSIGSAFDTPPTELEFYYPLSPTRALLMDFAYSTALTESRHMTVDETSTFNQMIVAMADGQIYARTENALIAASNRGA